jgi:hypothetical protein
VIGDGLRGNDRARRNGAKEHEEEREEVWRVQDLTRKT